MTALVITVVLGGAAAVLASLWSLFWYEVTLNASRRRNWDTAILGVSMLALALWLVAG
jgi:hypothetical protein